MDDMTAFERQLAAELGRMAGPGRRIDALAMVRAVSTPPMKWRVQAMFSATKFAAAGAIVTLFGGMLLTGILGQPSDDTVPVVGASASPAVQPTFPATAEPELETPSLDEARIDDTESVNLPGTFSPSGALSLPRMGHTATLLRDGRVLVVGGFSTGDSVGSAELWDTETASFSPAGSLVEPRSYHTATLMSDGRVLIVGGHGLVARAARDFRRRSGIPRQRPSAQRARFKGGHIGHTATLLPDGRVLVVGGLDGHQGTARTAEVWDSETESFGLTDLLAGARGGHTATLLPDGRVLIVGGEGEGAGGRALVADPSAEVWDPVTGSSSPAGSLAEGRLQHTATLLPDGRVLVVGGQWLTGSANSDDAYAPTSLAEVWDPVTASFDPAGTPVAGARRGHTATLLPDGRVLVVGGLSGYHQNDTNTLTVHGTAEIWDPVTASFSLAGSPLVEARQGHTATLLPDGRIFVVGGANDAEDPIASAEVWEPGEGRP